MALGGEVWLCTPSAVEAEAIGQAWPRNENLIYVTGVGAVATTEALWRRLHSEGPPRALIVMGLAGTYRNEFPPHERVQVQREVWAALGRRQMRKLTPLPTKLLRDFPTQIESLAPELPLPQVIGLTIESVSACRKEAAFWKRTYPDAVIETQENAAYLRVGAVLGVPVYALRLISNRVGERHWNRFAALEALATFAQDVGLPLYQRLMDSPSRT